MMPPHAATHPGLEWLRATDQGARWLDSLPRRIEECREEWSLRLGEPYPYAHVSIAVRAELPDRTPVVLKVQFPDRENEHEAEALRVWNGEGAVRLLAHHARRHALLLEQCQPGTPLIDAGDERALDVLVELLPRLWKPAGVPFRSLAVESGHWLEGLEAAWERHGRPFERRLVDAARETLLDLPPSQGEQVLLHQDLHGANVLRAAREPWLVIDPKPLVGEREFSVAPIVRGAELGHERNAVIGRLDRLSAELGLDRERARAWTVTQTVAWAFDGPETVRRHADVARWLLDR
jgi:streptomycin 6-kinase